MLSRLTTHKIQPDHLERLSFIYVRQSSLAQVFQNTASTARQYDLVQRALDLGWPRERIVVIDQDQGQSGASATGRDGFQSLISEVGLGRAGAVLCLEASRLARSCSDWYRLIEICALADTLVVDEEGVYDPRQYNDRLLLGFKGTMSEAELHWLRNRLLGGKLQKAQKGQLRFRLPTGLVYDPAGQVSLDPDEQVQAAIRLVFDLFDELGSARAVVKHFTNHQLLFPTRSWGGVRDGELGWRPLNQSRVRHMLHNPAYAGVYVYGRTKMRTHTLPGEAPRVKGRTRQVKREDWPIVLHDAHPGYITWEQFLRNQQRLADNCNLQPEERRGAAREGAALLQGIVLCGLCGRRMVVRYSQPGIPCYLCNYARAHFGGKTCQFIRGDSVDAAVARIFLEAMQPAQLEVSLTALDQIKARAQQIDRQWQLRLERAHYEAALAQRRFCFVEPENRLVARSLERDWNEKLAEIERLESEYAALPKLTAYLASPEERQRILALAQDLPTVWHSATTNHAERKQLLRFLIKDVTLTKGETTIHIGIRWQTEALTTLEIPRPQRVFDAKRTDPAVVNRVRELALTHTDEQIAILLNQDKFTTGTGLPFTRNRVRRFRYAYKIPTSCPHRPAACPDGQRGDGRYSTHATAELLNVSIATIATWCRSGRLDGIRATLRSPWWIKLTPEIIAELRKPVRQRRKKTVVKMTDM
jgi:DNA invertase Pin-like site-specific DNA recombinase